MATQMIFHKKNTLHKLMVSLILVFNGIGLMAQAPSETVCTENPTPSATCTKVVEGGLFDNLACYDLDGDGLYEFGWTPSGLCSGAVYGIALGDDNPGYSARLSGQNYSGENYNTYPLNVPAPLNSNSYLCDNRDIYMMMNLTGGGYGFLTIVNQTIVAVGVTPETELTWLQYGDYCPNTATCSVEGTATNVSCSGGNDGSITTIAEGIAPLTYAWSNGTNTANVSGLSAGDYTVTITDAEACTSEATVTISEPSLLTCTTVQNAPVVCNGQANGVATVSPTGGTAPYFFTWDNGETTAMASALTAGMHTVVVTDNNNCTSSCQVMITEPAAFTCTASQNVPVVCNGQANGVATVSPTGGTAPYSFAWDNGETTATATALTAGLHTVVVTDNNNCVSSCQVMITAPTTFNCMASQNTPVVCNGQANGVATVSPTGGTAPYFFTWDNGETTAMASALTAGMHTVVVTDNNNCTSSCQVMITEPAAFTCTASQDAPVICYGQANGTSTVTPTGGTAPYSFTWDNGETTAMASALTAGMHTVVVTDNNNCVSSCQVMITEPAALSCTASQNAPVICYGQANGTSTVTPTGGTAPYSFTWDNGETTAMATALTAGMHTVVVIDNNNCISSCQVMITEPPLFEVSCTAANEISCFGGDDGMITATVNGGNGPYTFDWGTSGNGASSIVGISAGTYTVIVTDADGCTSTCSSTLTEPSMLEATCTLISNATCSGGNDGMASASATGGTAPYSFNWGPGINPENLYAGTYVVTVTDANQCEATCSVIVSQPSDLMVTCQELQPVSCYGGNDGMATVNITGGTAPYSIDWGGKNPDALSYGSYFVLVRDANGCAISCNVFITQPDQLDFMVTSTPTSCATTLDGTIEVANVTGGVAPYTYEWNTGATTSSLEDLAGGFYCVTVTDINECSTNNCYQVIQTPYIQTYFYVPPSSCGGAPDPDNNCLTVSPSGGLFPYTYEWSNGSTENSICDLAEGTYTVTITDANGCTGTGSTSMNYSGINCEPKVTSNYNGFNVSEFGACDGSATIEPVGGFGPYTFNWSNGATTAAVDGLCAGQYCVTVTDNGDCESICCLEITEPEEAPEVCYEVSGTAYLDENTNGTQEWFEPGVQYVIVSLFTANGELESMALTNSDGVYVFDCVYPGDYYISFNVLGNESNFVEQDGITITTAEGGDEIGTTDVFTVVDQDLSNINIGLSKGSRNVQQEGNIGYDQTTITRINTETVPLVGGFEESEPKINLIDINAYPNPFSERFELKAAQLIISETVEVAIYNVDGKLIKTMNWNTGNSILNIDLSEEAAGLYLVKISDVENNTFQTLHLIKQ